MTTVLVPLDGSPLAEAALAPAERLARAQGARIVLLTVGELAETSRHRTDEHHALREVVDRAARLVTEVPVSVRVEMAGSPAETIAHVAEEEHASQIVMSTHGRSGMSRVIAGSVASGVLQHSTVPVTLIRPGIAETDAERRFLRSGDCAAVAAAAQSLAAAGAVLDDEDLERVRRCIDEIDENRRLQLVEAYLALLPRSRRPQAMAAFLSSRDPIVREGALESSRLVDETAIPAIAALLSGHSTDSAWSALETIRRIDGPAAIPPLLRGLTHESTACRWVASNGLLAIGRPALVPLLHALAATPGSIVYHTAARRVLRHLDAPAHREGLAGLVQSLAHETTVVQSPVLAAELVREIEGQPA